MNEPFEICGQGFGKKRPRANFNGTVFPKCKRGLNIAIISFRIETGPQTSKDCRIVVIAGNRQFAQSVSEQGSRGFFAQNGAVCENERRDFPARGRKRHIANARMQQRLADSLKFDFFQARQGIKELYKKVKRHVAGSPSPRGMLTKRTA
jgi:hypothetical protein